MVSVDAVYQKVLAIANKEQRGYITPQEFNLFADHAQMEIFDQYFYDLEQFKRRPGSEIKHADLGDAILEKIDAFSHSQQVFDGDTLEGDIFYRIESVHLTEGETFAVKTFVEKVTIEQFVHAASGSLTKHTHERPVYRFKNNKFTFNPSINPLGHYFCYYTKKPVSPNWTYVIVGESAMFDDLVPGFNNFELHHSEETLLVIKILQLAGINIKDPALVQIASQKEIKKTQQEKQ